MKTLLFIVLMLFSSVSMADIYIEAGLGIHNESTDCPEVCFGDDFLGTFAVGYELKPITISFEHTSAVFIKERGRGLNAVWIKARAYF